MTITVIGLGLIGGSMAIDLKKRGFATKVIGADINELHKEAAIRLGIVDEVDETFSAIKKADIVVLAVPVDTTLSLLPKVLDVVDKQVVTDVCSTKGNLSERVKYHPKRQNYVGSHPMAGTEHSGPWAAMSGLFDGRAVILSDVEDSSNDAIELIREMYECLNLRPLFMNSYNHDVHAAYVSHISHISSMALALTVLEKEKNEKNILDLASGGFESTVRLAKSPASMWTPIFAQNSVNVISVLDTYISKLEEFKEAIQAKNKPRITELIDNSNKIKRVLKR